MHHEGDPDQLTFAWYALDRMAAEVSSAASELDMDAVDTSHFSDQATGHRALTAAMREFGATLNDRLGELRRHLSTVESLLRHTAAEYQQTDGASARTFNSSTDRT